MKKYFDTIKDYWKPLGASGFSFGILQYPSLERPEIVNIIFDFLRILASLTGIIYTIIKTYYLLKDRKKNDKKKN